MKRAYKMLILDDLVVMKRPAIVEFSGISLLDKESPYIPTIKAPRKAAYATAV